MIRYILYLFFLLIAGLPLNARQVDLSSTNLPLVVIDTDGQEIPDDPRIIAHMGIIDNGPGQRNAPDDPFNDYDGRIAIELRGSSSLSFPKKQYRLETQDALGENLNVPLLGLPAENDWVLYAPYSDKSLMRNVLAYDLSRRLGRYAPRTRFCELILNGDYRGVYVLTETVKRDRNRVDISTLNPDEITGDDVTGGYLIKIDKREGEDIGGWYSPFPPYPGSGTAILFQYHYPRPDEIVPEQADFVQSAVDRFETALYTGDPAEPVPAYGSFIDINSFVDYLILTELAKNVDGYRLSTYFYRDKASVDSLWHMGPLWDFNLAFGNADYYDGGEPRGWQYDINQQWQFVEWNDQFKVPFWWQKLLSYDPFTSQLKCRWDSLRNGVLHRDSIACLIQAWQDTLAEAQERNFIRWPVLGTYVWPNRVVLDSWTEEIGYLIAWIATRLNWMDDHMPGICTGTVNVRVDKNSVPGSFTVSQNYPNPFNQRTVIEFDLPGAERIRFDIFDIDGQRIWSQETRKYAAGSHRITWNGTDDQGRPAGSGVYFYRIRGVTSEQSGKMVLLR